MQLIILLASGPHSHAHSRFKRSFSTVLQWKFLMYNRAWSILAETEEPKVLTSFFRNRKEPEPNFSKKSEPY